MPDKNVQMPDGRIVAFPDSMADTDISAVIKKQLTPTQPKNYLPGRQFGMDIAKGMGLDAEKIKAAEDAGGQSEGLKEIGRQVYEGLSNFVGSVAKDPFNAAQPVHGMASNLTKAAGLPDTGSVFDSKGYHAPSIGETMGALSNILGGTEGASKTAEAAGKVRPKIGEVIHTPEGELKPGAELAGKVAGGAAGAAAGAAVGHEYLGAAAGYKMGPALMERLFPEPKTVAEARARAAQYQAKAEDLMRRSKEQAALDRQAARTAAQQAKIPDWQKPAHDISELGSPEYPGEFSKIPTRLTIEQQEALRGGPTSLSDLAKPSPFEAGPRNPKGKIVSPESEPPDIKVTYQSVPQADLLRLVKSGDRLAISEWQRRGLSLPSNVGFMVEEAGSKAWRNPKR